MSFRPFPLLVLKKADECAEKGEIGEACGYYLVAFGLDRGLKELPNIGEKFLLMFCEWCDKLEKEKRYDQLLECYEQATTVLPDDVFLLNKFGSFFLRCGLLEKAAFYFRQCLDIDPDYLEAAHNLEKTLILQVERWHFRMLNDRNRNEGFREAITKKIGQGFDRVLDVGTGTGLFSLFCSKAKAKKIYACEVSPAMLEIAKNVLSANSATDIKLIEKHSSDLQIPEDLDERVSLLVTETFDVGLLGEHILPTLTHAWNHLLLPPQPQTENLDPVKYGLVIPYKAVMYVTGTQFDELANDFHLKQTDNLNQCLFVDWNVLRSCEHYDSQDLSRAHCKFLTETERISEINFNDPDALLEFQKGWNKDMTLKCKSNGRLDCFAVWFDLHLDEDIVLSTSPVKKCNSAWDQAVFLLPRSILVREEQDIKITISFDTSELKIILSGNCTDDPKFMASEDVIKMLNNEKLARELHQVVENLAPVYTKPVSILDCYPFPVFGMNFLRYRSDRYKDELTCFVPIKNDQKLVSCMAEKYGVKIDVEAKKKPDFETDLSDKKFDIILLDVVEMTGEIKDEIVLLFSFFKTLLKPGGIILPKHVTVIGQFIYSDWLAKVSKVSNESMPSEYNVAWFINKYQVQHAVDFDLKSIDSIICSEPFELFNLFCSKLYTIREVPNLSSAQFVNAMVYWIKIKFMENSEEMQTINDTFYHQGAILFAKLKLSRKFEFFLLHQSGLFTVDLLKPSPTFDRAVTP